VDNAGRRRQRGLAHNLEAGGLEQSPEAVSKDPVFRGNDDAGSQW
jgi:hypothetical protein